MKLLFLSDIHYKNGEMFLNFLKSIYKSYDKIYIVGDLFEFYYGYDFLFCHHVKLIELLKEISDEKKVYIFEGNHEYKLEAIKKFLPNIEIVKKELIENIDAKLFYIEHGDCIDKKDKTYRLFRSILKNPFTLKIIKLISPVFLLKLAHIASKISKNNLKNKALRKTDIALEEFATQLIKKGFDYVILAHTHNPLLKTIDNGIYANIGDFCEHFTYIEYDKTLTMRKYHYEKN
jgi:UDP-2,3-diacylglucosamine hydrolase